MPSLDLLLPFFVASAVFACVPGPGMFYAAAQTVSHGSRAGWLAALGFHLGGYVHILAAAFGLAIVLSTVPVLYAALKLVGAAYLIWLGVRYFAGSGQRTAASTGMRPTGRKSFRDSILVEILNPKTALFYLAFLPQFTDGAAAFPVSGQIVVLGLVVNAMFSLTDVACILLSDMVTKRLGGSRRLARLAQRVCGGVLVAFGVNLGFRAPEEVFHAVIEQ